MTKLRHPVLLAVALILLVLGCEGVKDPIDVPTPGSAFSGKLVTPDNHVPLSTHLTLAGFTVSYDGRVYDGAADLTTFSYTVEGPAVAMHFRVELPCSPPLYGWEPTSNVSFDDDPLISPSIAWHPPVGSGTTNTFTFQIIFQGDVCEGTGKVSVKSHDVTEVGTLPGPCKVFSISGNVFTDANTDQDFDPINETGIGGVTVDLVDTSNAVVASTTTAADGSYIFNNVSCGDYCIKVDTTTVSSSSSSKYMETTTPTTICVTVGPDTSGNDFGFSPKTKDIINDLKAGTLTTDGKTANFWKKQLQVEISGKGNLSVPPGSLVAWVSQIRGLLLPEPYSLPNGDGLQDAYDILSRPVKTDFDKLLRELLAAQFNYVAGLGTDPGLQLVLIGWGEALVQSSLPTPAMVHGKREPILIAAVSGEFDDAIAIFSALNSSGGGGGGRE